MKKSAFLICVCLSLVSSVAFAGECQKMKSGEDWKLAVQCWSFHRFTFEQALEKAQAVGLNYVEIFPGMIIKGDSEDRLGHDMTDDNLKLMMDMANAAGIKIINYGVVGLPGDEAECRRVFEFARKVGIENIASEPAEEDLDMIEKLADEYGINVAIHNHPKDSHYWNPDTVLAACKGRSKRIGACADTGHWSRSGIDPVEAVKKLKGRIIYLHFKDLNEFGNPAAHDVPWGTGASKVKEVMARLDKQGFKGVFSIEYEHNWDNSVPDMIQCAQFWRKTAKELGRSDWDYLFDEDLSRWNFREGTWKYEDGAVSLVGGDYLWSKEEFGDFLLELDYKISEGGNSGVFLRLGDIADWVNTSIEVQIHDTGDGNPRGVCGAIYDCLIPTKAAQKPAGEWNSYRICAKGSNVNAWLNGEHIIEMDLNEWTEAGMNPDGTPNKFKYAYKDMPRVGNIGLQDHGDPVWFRNARIIKLDSNCGKCCKSTTVKEQCPVNKNACAAKKGCN